MLAALHYQKTAQNQVGLNPSAKSVLQKTKIEDDLAEVVKRYLLESACTFQLGKVPGKEKSKQNALQVRSSYAISVGCPSSVNGSFNSEVVFMSWSHASPVARRATQKSNVKPPTATLRFTNTVTRVVPNTNRASM